ncbi:MAG: hypothetical protein R3F19_32280 [Verrucomicrobiales bacterium]
MKQKSFITAGLCRISVATIASSVFFLPAIAEDDDAKEGNEKSDAVTIEHVMEETHKGKGDTVVKRAIAGTSAEGELKQLLAYYLAMEKLEPPKGELDSWKTKTAAVSDALIGVLAEKEDARATLKEALNCKACHSKHKGD